MSANDDLQKMLRDEERNARLTPIAGLAVVLLFLVMLAVFVPAAIVLWRLAFL